MAAKWGGGVDKWVEDFQTGTNDFFKKMEDTVAGVAGNVLMPFIEPTEGFAPDGDFPDSDDEQEEAHKTGRKKPADLRKEHDTRNKQLLEGAFLGTLHLQMDYAYEQRTLNEELLMVSHNLELGERALDKKVPKWGEKKDKDWRAVKVKMLMGSKQERKKILDQIMPPKLRDRGDWRTKRDTEAQWVKWLLDSKKQVRELKHQKEQLEEQLEKLKTANPGSKTALKFLIEEHADINCTDPEGFTALMLAARNGRTETVKELLTETGIIVDQTNKYGSNAMHYAAMYAHKDICELLRKGKGSKERCQKNVTNCLGKTPVELAIDEHRDLLEHKEKNWRKTHKERHYMEVKEMQPKDPEETEVKGLVYNKLFNLHNPEKVDVPKKYKPGTWRISKVPDPACRVGDMTEAEYMQRWKSAAKKIWIGNPPKPGQDIHEIAPIPEAKKAKPEKK